VGGQVRQAAPLAPLAPPYDAARTAR